jgi:hypothetical protein
MIYTKPTLDPKNALADIQTLARVPLERGEMAVMRRDLEMILTSRKWSCRDVRNRTPPERSLFRALG